ncbi:hypothetical protein N8370_04400 [Amylibacter sp.]|nr:hypothetical protein [Amylibacter sp.]
MRFSYKSFLGFLKIQEIYFENIEMLESNEKNYDILKFIQCDFRKNILPQNYWNFSTVLIDLSEDKDLIKNNFKKTMRYDINKSYKFNCAYKSYGNEIENNRFDIIINKLNTFLNSKGLPNSNNKKIFEMIRAGVCCITECNFVDNGAISKNFHFYLVDKLDKRVRLLYSFSNHSKKIGFDLNKRHLFDDIGYFKEKSFRLLDLGGISLSENINSRDKFKMAFGGKVEMSKCAYVHTSFLGYFVLLLLKILKKY